MSCLLPVLAGALLLLPKATVYCIPFNPSVTYAYYYWRGVCCI